MNDMKIKPQVNLKKKFLDEIYLFFTYTLFIFILFSIFNIYERLLLDDYGKSHMRYGYSLIEALILAKVILIGQAVNLGSKFKHKPLYISILYKTLVFSIVLVLLTVGEHFIMGYFAGRTWVQTYHELMQQQLNIILAKNFIMIIIFAQFFTVLALSQALGEHKLYELFFKTTKA